jgi:hypothetical protein
MGSARDAMHPVIAKMSGAGDSEEACERAMPRRARDQFSPCALPGGGEMWRIFPSMKEQVTICVQHEVLEAARAEVESGEVSDLSAAVERALRAASKSKSLREALEISEAIHGPIGREAAEWGQRELERAFREMSSSKPEPSPEPGEH